MAGKATWATSGVNVNARAAPSYLAATPDPWTIVSMITFDFDRAKLSAREAQIVGALIASHWELAKLLSKGAKVAAGITIADDREIAQLQAEHLCVVLNRHLPDLGIRWRWEAPSAPP